MSDLAYEQNELDLLLALWGSSGPVIGSYELTTAKPFPICMDKE